MLFNTYDPFRIPSAPSTSRRLDHEVFSNEEGVTLRIDIPGIDPDTVDLTVDGRSLRIEAARESSIPEGSKIVSRRRDGSISQTFQLGERLDADKLEADYEFGVLTVTVPVAESAKPRKVTVGAGAPALAEGDNASDNDADSES